MFSVPSVISLVLNALYNMVDQIFIGNGVGYLGNGATNVIFPLTQLAIAIGLLIGDGTASYMNLKLGEGKREEAEKGMAAGLAALAASGVALSILLTVFLQPLCRLFGATDDIMPYALDYGYIIVAGTIFNIFPCGAMSIVRIFGSADPLYNEFSVKCLRIFLMLIFLDSFQMVGSSFLQSIGKPIPATALVLFRQIIVQVPALLILGELFGIDGLLYAGALSSLLVGILAIVFLAREWRALREGSAE